MIEAYKKHVIVFLFVFFFKWNYVEKMNHLLQTTISRTINFRVIQVYQYGFNNL